MVIKKELDDVDKSGAAAANRFGMGRGNNVRNPADVNY